MKKLLIATALMVSTFAIQAAPCVSKDGYVFEEDTNVTLYYVKNPKKEIGPNYTCKEVSRVRFCNDGFLESKPRVCNETDSGGCVDSWLDQLEDENFEYGSCQD